ncbi:hypothetical protein OD770_26475, partial [Pseudomonas aeruginosa]
DETDQQDGDAHQAKQAGDQVGSVAGAGRGGGGAGPGPPKALAASGNPWPGVAPEASERRLSVL